VTEAISLFTAGLLSAALLPIPGTSESVAIYLYLQGKSFAFVLCFASLGNIFGAGTNYMAGRFLAYKKAPAGAMSFVRQYGSPVLFFSFLPVIGDALTLAAGIIKIDWRFFLFWMSAGKIIRYAILLLGVDLLT